MKKAFTFIEILLVLCLLAVLIGMAQPKYSRHHKNTVLQQSAQTVLAQIRYARHYAVFRNQPVRLLLDKEHRILRLAAPEGIDIRDSFRLNPPGPTVIPSPLRISFEPEPIHFFPTGKCDPFEIVIQNDDTEIELNSPGFSGIPEMRIHAR